MRKIYLFLGVCSFGISGCFLWLSAIFFHADGMTPKEYARQAQELVCMQTAECVELKGASNAQPEAIFNRRN